MNHYRNAPSRWLLVKQLKRLACKRSVLNVIKPCYVSSWLGSFLSFPISTAIQLIEVQKQHTYTCSPSLSSWHYSTCCTCTAAEREKKKKIRARKRNGACPVDRCMTRCVCSS